MSDSIPQDVYVRVSPFFTDEQVAKRKAKLEQLARGEPVGTDGAGALGYVPPGQEEKPSGDTSA